MSTQTVSQRRSSRTPPLPTAARRGLALLAGVLGCAAIYGGGSLLVSGIAHYQAQAFIEHWEKKPAVPTEQAWLIAEDAIQRAIAAYPASNGAYLETLGYIQQWRAFGAQLNDPAVQEYRQNSLTALRASTQARPTWPDTWASLVYAKLTVLEFDDEFTHAIQQAQHYGPWRIGINRRIAEVGLIAYAVLNAEQQALVSESIQRTARYSGKERAKLFELAQQSNSLDPLCKILVDAPEAACAPVQINSAYQLPHNNAENNAEVAPAP